MEIHVVQPGQTLYSIAGQYGVEPSLLAQANGVAENGELAVGQTLVIERVRTFHTVQPGQTLSAIARSYGMSLRQLYRNNYRLGGNPAIQSGETLVIAYEGEKLGSTFTNGYAYPFISRELLSAQLPYMSDVTPFTYGITAQGGLLPLQDGMILEEAARLGTGALMHLSTLTEADTFSSQRAEMVLTDLSLQRALLSQIEATMARRGYRGLDVDFEYIPGAYREAYAAFIARLKERLSPAPVVVALAPKTRADQPGLLYEGHDYALLGEAADFVLLMTYGWELLAHTFTALALYGFCQIKNPVTFVRKFEVNANVFGIIYHYPVYQVYNHSTVKCLDILELLKGRNKFIVRFARTCHGFDTVLQLFDKGFLGKKFIVVSSTEAFILFLIYDSVL